MIIMETFPLLTMGLLLLLFCQDVTLAQKCYKKYLKRSGRCTQKIRIRGSMNSVGYETCCRHKGASAWRPSGATPICIKCHKIVDGGWSQWTHWSACPVKCDWGQKKRERKCDSPIPQHGGQLCNDANKQQIKCYAGVRCPIHGGWGNWSKWSLCSKSCKRGGFQLRNRKCNNPDPQFDGKDCLGESENSKRCNDNKECPVNGVWGSWSSWSACNIKCGGGAMTRKRQCDKPKPLFDGKSCKGENNENQPCFRKCSTPGLEIQGSGSGRKLGSGSGSGSASGSGSGSGNLDGLEVDTENGDDKEPSEMLKETKIVLGSGIRDGSGSGLNSEGLPVITETDVNKMPILHQNAFEKNGSGAKLGESFGEGSGGDKSIIELEDMESGDNREGELSGSGENSNHKLSASGKKGSNEKYFEEVSVESETGSNNKNKRAQLPGWDSNFEEI